MFGKRLPVSAILVLALVAIALSGCGGSSGSPSTSKKGPITVGSKIDTEGSLLGQMIIALLEKDGYEVVDRTRTGATDVVRKALLSGQIDVYPEYTANGILLFHPDAGTDPAVLQDAQRTYEQAKSLDASEGVVWLQPAPANNTWAVAVTKELAQSARLASLADVAAYVKGGGTFKIAGSQEFFDSEVAFPAFEKAYGFSLKPEQKLTLATGDTPATEKAAADGANGVNAAMAYGTDGQIAALGLVVLEDPKGAQPIYQPAPTVRAEVFEAYPELATILGPAFAKLDLATLQSLNAQVSIEGKDPKTVANDWLESQNLL